jgi:hypothetical protein
MSVACPFSENERHFVQQLLMKAHLLIPNLILKPPLRHHQNRDQTTRNQRACNSTNQHNTASTRRKLASDNIMLGFKVSVKPNEKHDNTDGDEGRSKWFSEVPKMAVLLVLGLMVVVVGVGREGGVEAEELRDCDADGGEGEGCAEPG